jgi:hypothetical protein
MGSRSLGLASIVAGRILLAAIAAAALAFGVVLVHRATHATSESAEGGKSYVCPMHPEVTSPVPGTCPICKMDLVLKPTKSAAASPTSLQLPTVSVELRAFDAVSKVKRFDISLEMRAPAWAESREVGVALLHRDQSRLIEPGEAALFSPSSTLPAIAVRASEQPPERWDDATDLVRFRVEHGAELVQGETGSVKFATRLRRDLVIRASAVRESSEGPYVLVASNGRHSLSKRPVEIGSRLYDHAAVISGLKEGEYVVAKHAFALDAERRFGSAMP